MKMAATAADPRNAPSDLGGHSAVIDRVRRGRDDVRVGIGPRDGLEPSRKGVDGDEGLRGEGRTASG